MIIIMYIQIDQLALFPKKLLQNLGTYKNKHIWLIMILLVS